MLNNLMRWIEERIREKKEEKRIREVDLREIKLLEGEMMKDGRERK